MDSQDDKIIINGLESIIEEIRSIYVGNVVFVILIFRAVLLDCGVYTLYIVDCRGRILGHNWDKKKVFLLAIHSHLY
jgi:hypothetical protein